MDAFSISLSGLAAQTTRLNATANNIANSNTPNYKAQRVVTTTAPSGGVSAMVSTDLSAGQPLAQVDGLPSQDGETSNVDLASEMVNLMTIRHGFQANLQALKASIQSKGSVVDIIS